jgi:hypothetical protein
MWKKFFCPTLSNYISTFYKGLEKTMKAYLNGSSPVQVQNQVEDIINHYSVKTNYMKW